MFRDVIHPDTSLKDWETLRINIRDKINYSMGIFPEYKFNNKLSTHRQIKKDGLIFESISFDILSDFTIQGTFVYAEKYEKSLPAILCIHETDCKLAHRNVIEPFLRPNSQYGIELAKKGYFILAIDQFGFNIGGNDETYQKMISQFYSKYPEWSLDGIRLYINQRALDVLSNRSEIDSSRIGCIGNSLGGRLVLYLAAFDTRIKVAVASSGVSPNITNFYRNIPGNVEESPVLNYEFMKSGKPLFEYQELLALIAPRAVLLIEPWNDPYNPYIEAVFRCFEKARYAYELYNSQNHFSLICHGDGHVTINHLRSYAYSWFDRYLKKKS